ncbi:hypothetical protein FRB96_006154 [Tulasnella sp. 330]|nr:hypothetical protein FRB96_006154 [Tulasnella sp. 330]
MNAIFTRHPPTARETKIYTILVLALVGITVVLNLATTLLIVIKLWLGGRRIGSGFYKPVMMMIVESGALYTVGMISYLIVALVGKPVAAVYTTRITNMLMGTAPTLIILRLSCGFFQQGDNHSSVATNTNVEFAQPRISPEESVADAVDTLTSGARVELQNSDMEKHAQESLERQ